MNECGTKDLVLVDEVSLGGVSGRRSPDVVRALLSILEFEGPLLRTVGAQL